MNFIPDVRVNSAFCLCFIVHFLKNFVTFGLMCAQRRSVRIERVSRIRSLSEVTAYCCESAGSECINER